MLRSMLILLALVVSCGCIDAQTTTVCTESSKATSLYCTPIVALQQFSVSPVGSPSIPIPAALTALNAAIGTQITALPAPSPISGFIFSFGPGGLSSARDLGPIFSERTGTVGKYKLYLGFSYQFFEFDQMNDVNLKQIPVQFGACAYGSQPGCGPYIQTGSRLDLKEQEFTSYATFGVTNRIDVSVAIPILNQRMAMNAGCTVCSQAQPSPQGEVLVFNPTDTIRSASGIGDVTFRVKGTVWQGERSGVSLGADLRVPTGDDLNLLGSGTTGFHPFGAYSYTSKYLSPHLNLGYQVNGSSILAAQANMPQHLPNSLTYAGGVDVGVVRSLGFNLDLLGQTFFGAQSIFLGTVLNNPSTQCTYSLSGKCVFETLNTNSLAIGAKYNPTSSLVLSGSVLIKVDNNGLHYKPSPMAGISYTF